jgi:hypothetical protein
MEEFLLLFEKPTDGRVCGYDISNRGVCLFGISGSANEPILRKGGDVQHRFMVKGEEYG